MLKFHALDTKKLLEKDESFTRTYQQGADNYYVYWLARFDSYMLPAW